MHHICSEYTNYGKSGDWRTVRHPYNYNNTIVSDCPFHRTITILTTVLTGSPDHICTMRTYHRYIAP